jgi:hypothetical protein
MGEATTPRCAVCGRYGIRLEIVEPRCRWLCVRHAEGIEEAGEERAHRAASLALRLRAVGIHGDLLSRSVAYRSGFESEGVEGESCPYDSRGLDSTLWRLGSFVATRGVL